MRFSKKTYLNFFLFALVFGLAFATGNILASQREVDRAASADTATRGSDSTKRRSSAVEQSGVVNVPELGVSFTAGGEISDIIYRTEPDGPEFYPAIGFSTTRLVEQGGVNCSFSSTGTAFPYPIGLALISTEDPQTVAAEQATEAESLGEFITKVGEKYLYYSRPASHDTCSQDPATAQLQVRQIEAIKVALKTARPIETVAP